MLETGVRLNEGGLTLIESRSHFNAWAIVSSPLILSHDTTDDNVTDAIWPIITNTEAIAVNQAWAGFSGSVFKQDNVTMIPLYDGGELDFSEVPAWQMFYKPTAANGAATAVLAMNHGNATVTLSFGFGEVPGLSASSNYKVRDINARADIGTFDGTYTISNLASHDAAFLMITPA
jgi:alpha-galactosidase